MICRRRANAWQARLRVLTNLKQRLGQLLVMSAGNTEAKVCNHPNGVDRQQEEGIDKIEGIMQTQEDIHRQTDVKQAQVFEKLFPTYTGSMTALIEECFDDVHLESLILTQRVEPLEGFLADLTTVQGFKRGENVIHRRVLLRDKKTKENFLYASCLLNINRLPKSILRGIEKDPEKPLGRYLNAVQLEKVILSTANRSCCLFLAEQFSRHESELCHVRRVLFSIERSPAMLIEEVFPCRSGNNCPLLTV